MARGFCHISGNRDESVAAKQLVFDGEGMCGTDLITTLILGNNLLYTKLPRTPGRFLPPFGWFCELPNAF